MNTSNVASSVVVESYSSLLQMDGLHFLAVQEDEEDEEPKGFWLLKDVAD